MATARGEPKNAKITRMTMMTASPNVRTTSLIALVMNSGRIVGDVRGQALRQLGDDRRIDRSHPLDDVQHVGGRRHFDSDLHRSLAVEPGLGVIGLRNPA